MLKRNIFQECLKEISCRFKDNTAVEYGSQFLTYNVLDKKSDSIAHLIMNRGIGRETSIGILTENRLNLITLTIGILKAGCVIVPLYTNYPTSRIISMIDLTDLQYIFIDEINIRRFENEKNLLKKRSIFISIEEVERWEEKEYAKNIENPGLPYNPEDKLYIHFTSGTTGIPKAIVGKNKSLLHFLDWEIETFNINSESRVAQFTIPGFDPFLRDVFAPLLAGGVVCIPENEGILIDAVKLKEWVNHRGITLIHCVASLFRSLSSRNLAVDDFKSLKYIMLAGEKIFPSDLIEWYNAFGDRIQLANCYGPTETTMSKVCYFIQQSDVNRERIPIGKPIKGAGVIILDEEMEECDPLEVGEICIQTDYRSWGYYNDPAANKEKFIQNPFTDDPDDILYKSGDLGRFLLDGNIDILGRIDRQVKIRGYRVELEEIETMLISYPLIKEAVVIKKESPGNNEMLCAYITGSEVKEEAAFIKNLREFLSEKLPGYMVPAQVKKIDKIPLGNTGKVNFKALPDQFQDNEHIYTPPRNNIERRLLKLWAEILRIEEIGINEHFFELGGNSLNTMSLISKIHREFDIRIALAEIFNNPTIEMQANIIEGAKKNKYASIEIEEVKEYYALSPAQNRLYILYQMEPGSVAYNMTQMVVMEEDLEREKLEQTFAKLIKRHESLRTSFHMINDEPVQKIHAEVEFKIEYYRVDEKEQATDHRGQNTGNRPGIHPSSEFIRPFDLSDAPLLRVGLLETGETGHILMVDMHHIISDGVSHEILTRNFVDLYTGKELSPLPFQYKDFSRWQNRDEQIKALESQGEYWLREFVGEIPVLHLPTDYARPAVQSFEGSTLEFEIGIKETKALNQLAKKEGATLYIVLLAAFNILLAKLSNQEDIVIGTPVAGRRHADLEQIIGMFVNTLAVRNFPINEKRLADFLREVKENTLNAFENQDYPFEELVEELSVNRDVSRNPLFDVMFALQNMESPKVEIPVGLKLSPFKHKKRISKFDLELSAVEAGERLRLIFEYRTRLFRQETIKRFISYFKKLVTSILTDPGIKIYDMEIISAEEKQKILFDFNDTGVDYPGDRMIHELFEEQVGKTPGNVSVLNADGVPLISYRELNNRSNQLARVLIEKGVERDTILCIMVERSIEMIVGILGILKSGGAYLPIAPGYPEERKRYMIEDGGARLMITQKPFANSFRDICEVVVLDDADLYEGGGETGNRVDAVNSSNNLAYVIYTSGSTGKPKGVALEHRSVVNRLNWMQRFYPIEEKDVILQKTVFTFDVSVWELFWWSFYGASVCLLNHEDEKSPEAIKGAIEKSRITILHFVPSMLNVFLEYLEGAGATDVNKLGRLKQVFSSGEALGVHQVKRFNKLLETNGTRLINLYGPTEAAVDVSYFNCPTGEKFENTSIPIGKPIDNIRIYILNKCGCVQPIGVGGELSIAGDGVARGYLNRPELIKEKFAKCGFIRGERLYRTGDLARWLPDGNIEFLGRIDHQVKIRGFRIELEEIEHHLLGHDDIQEAVVAAKEDNNRNLSLRAYFVSEKEFSVSKLRSHISEKLPDYMLPSYFIPLKKIPLTQNGKVDRKSLPDPEEMNLNRDAVYIAPRNAIERKTAEIWKNVLGINSVGINDNFFEIGGDSINAIRIISRMKMAGYVIEMKHIFRTPRISDLIPFIKQIEPIKDPAISYSSSGEKKELTPGDLTYPELSLDVFQQLQEKYSNLVEDIYPLTPMQEGMLFYTLYEDKARPLYFQQMSYRLHNKLNVISFKRTLKELFKRHDILRTVFIYEGLNRPLQVVLKERNVDFYYEDLRESIPDPLDKEIFIREFREKDQRRSFDLGEDILMRVALIQLTDTEYYVAWSSHHILLDGWCIGILISEFSEIYAAYTENREFQLSPVKPYRNYIQWLEKQEKDKTRNYWRKYLEGYEEIAAVPRKESRGTFEGGYKAAAAFTRFEEDKTIALSKVAVRNRVTLNTVIQAVWGIVLGKYSSKQDVVFGMLVSGRPSEVEGVDSMVGCFINTIPVRINFDGNIKYNELLRTAQDKAIESEPHHYFSLAEIQAESTLKQNLLDHIIQFQNFPIAEGLERWTEDIRRDEVADDIREKQNTEPMELSNLNAFEQGGDYNFYITITPLDQIELSFSYNANLYDRALVEQLGLNCLRVLEQITEDDKITIDEIAFLSKEERQKILFEFNNNKVEFSRDKTIYQFVEKYAEIAPDGIALVSVGDGLQDITLTYKKLNEKANGLAGILRSNGIQKDETVGILMERSKEMVESILAVWKAGGAYIPLDISYPLGRIAGILQDSTTKVLITCEEYVNSQLEKEYEGEIIKLGKTNPGMSGEDTYQAIAKPDLETPMSSLAYVIYTSGSTGKPKGVMIEHLGMMNHIQAKINDLHLTRNSVVSQNATHTFDISVWQFFAALIPGGKTIVYPNKLILNPEQFVSRLVKDDVTILEVVPPYLSMLLDDEVNQLALPKSLQYLLVTGEVLKPYLVRRWFDKYPGIKMVNAYGPTEASDDITHYIISQAPDMERIPIGKPLQNLNIYIVDNRMQLCPIGVKGEICVSGLGVGRGYLGDEEKTKHVFMEDPFASPITNDQYPMTNDRLYKTGDLGCWRPDGTIDFFGRKDYQVKIRGFRIELGEIENRLLNHLEIKEAVVIDREDKVGNKYLCAYVVYPPGHSPGATKLKEYLLEHLPDYMIPAHFIPLENIPLTPSGKLDRKALPGPEGSEIIQKYVPPKDTIEKKLVGIWSEVLGKEEGVIGVNHSFFDLGGHSLKAIVLISKIHKEFDAKVPLAELFRTPTIRDLSHYIKKAVKDRFEVMELVEKKEYYMLSSAQKRLYIEQQMSLEGTAYNISQIIMLEDKPDRRKLEDTFRKLIDRHESLRTSFHLVAEVPVQKIHEHVDFFIDDFETDEKKARRIAARYERFFDLSKAPLLRAALFNVEQKHHVLLVVMHHIITDGTSYPILVNDFNAFYEEKELPLLKLQYKDYAEWQNSPAQQETIKKQEKYWLKEFEGEIPVLNLSNGYDNQGGSDVGGSGIKFVINKEETAALRKLILEEGATLFMVLLTLYYILLSKVSGQEDIVIGTPAAGRRHEDLKQLIGMFVNTVALRNYPTGDKTFKGFFKEVKIRTLEAFENQDYQFEDLVGNILTRRDAGQNPLFDVMFVMQNLTEPGRNALEIENPKPYKADAKFDLILTAMESEENLTLNLVCKAGLFSAETIERFSRYFREIVSAVLNNKEIKIKEIKISHELFDQKIDIPREEEGDFAF